MKYQEAHSKFLGHIIEFVIQSDAITKLLVTYDTLSKPVEELAVGLNYPNAIDTEASSPEFDRDCLYQAKATYAGAIFIVLSNWVQTVGEQLRVSKQDYLSTGESINGAFLSGIIWAAANNFRHYQEWTTVTKKNQDSILVLETIGLKGPWNQNLTPTVLDVVDLPRNGILVLNLKMARIGDQIFQRSTGEQFRLQQFLYGYSEATE